MTRSLLSLTTMLPAIALLAACSDYNLESDKEASQGTEDSGDPMDDETGFPDDPDVCEDFREPDSLVIEPNAFCEVDESIGTFSPVTEWSYGSTSFCGPPAAGVIADSDRDGDLDDDDLPVILAYQNGAVHAVWGDGFGVAWQAMGRSYGQDGGFALGDVSGDGWPDVITASESMVCALDGNTGVEHWCRNGLSAALDPMGYSYPSVADLDGDGQAEVIAGSAILEGANGDIRALGRGGRGAAPYGGDGTSGTYGAISAAVDLDGDGQLEVVTGSTAYDANGNVIWSSGLDGLVAIADFDLDGEGEIVKTSGIYVTGMETDGTQVWGPLAYTGNLGAPAVDDLDGDGVPEIVFAAQNQLVAMEWGGRVIWTSTITDSSGAAGPTLFDFEMDGYPEVLYADETSVRFFSGRDGTVKFQSTQHASYTILETPIVADVDNDDQVEIILGHCQGDASIGSFTVYGDADESWPPGRKWWSQHGYHITHIDNDGTAGTEGNNFALYNSFRSGDVGRPPSEFWDLRGELIDVCEDECDTGRVTVQARVLNAGNIDSPAGIQMSLRAGETGAILATATVSGAVTAGTSSQTVTFEVDAADIAGTAPYITADEDASGNGSVYECVEDNNSDLWNSTVCEG
jgi:hypothetical protein